jgi:hypothetical protein
MPRRPIPALLLVAALVAILAYSVPAAVRVVQASGWHWETLLAAIGAHLLVVGGIGWLAWLFWAARRPGDGG